MMKRSFAEYYLQKDAPENEKKLDELQQKITLLKDPDCPICSVDLKNYYLTWAEVFQLHKEIKVRLELNINLFLVLLNYDNVSRV